MLETIHVGSNKTQDTHYNDRTLMRCPPIILRVSIFFIPLSYSIMNTSTIVKGTIVDGIM